MARRLMSLTAPLATLPEVEAAIWRELAAALRTRGHAWRQAVLATTDGTAGDARTVIVREVDAAARTLTVYTDARSAKAAQVEAFPQGTLVLWSAPLGWQLRLRVQLALQVQGDAVMSRWERLKSSAAAADYRSTVAPGSQVAAPRVAIGEQSHFALLTARVQAVDWLELHADGHRRACFDATGQHWLAP